MGPVESGLSRAGDDVFLGFLPGKTGAGQE